MSGTYAIQMGDRGRLVVPAELRDRLRLQPGSPVLLLETRRGVVLVTRDQARKMLRDDLAGVDIVAELLAERRAQAADEDS